MGYFKRPGTEITDFWPDDTEAEKYVDSSSYTSLQDLIDLVAEKWPTVPFEEINISAEKIHTHALYYDRYDSGDHTDFIVLKCSEKGLEIARQYFKTKEMAEQLENQLDNKATTPNKMKI